MKCGTLSETQCSFYKSQKSYELYRMVALLMTDSPLPPQITPIFTFWVFLQSSTFIHKQIMSSTGHRMTKTNYPTMGVVRVRDPFLNFSGPMVSSERVKL